MSSFLTKTIERARAANKHIVLPEGSDPRTWEAAKLVVEKGIAGITVLASPDQVPADFAAPGVQILDPATADCTEELADALFELRQAKGMTREQAADTILDPLYFGVMMVKTGKADGAVAGAVNATSAVLRAALQILKTAPGTKLVSSYFIMDVPYCEYGENGVFLYSDCGLVENPDAEMLSEIAISSAGSFEALVGKEAQVAMLSYSTYGSAKSLLTEKVVEATALAREKRPDIKLDGELQLDAAIVEAIGKSKAPESTVAGKANVLIFPDLNSGNIAYKLTERLAKAEAYGPITQGIGGPVNDLSRGCSVDDIVGVVAITAVQAAG
ncbi:MAG: phosphate acetyltransferase [Coriobacteriia bacterium]|nr:phosphate acetyltransferase [Coriobacteriia bacterium]MCL2537582.1 phosphate acetyltransferase [Coriobacteriia bacterium]